MDARLTALHVLARVLREEAYSNLALTAAFTRAGTEAAPADKRLVTELVYGVLRRLNDLDWRLAALVDRPLAKLDDAVLDVLRLSLFQLLALDRIPPHAVLSEAGRLLLARRKRSAVPFANAVLRRFLRERESGREPAVPVDPIDALALRASLPRHVLDAWGRETALAALALPERLAVLEERTRAVNTPAPLTLALHPLRTEAARAKAELEKDTAVRCENGRYWPGALHLVKGGLDAAHPLIARGEAWVMDEAAQLVAALGDARPGERVLDVCAAPGGKSLMLAAAVGSNGSVLALDIAPQKLALLAESRVRFDLPWLSTLAHDSATPLPAAYAPASFDLVLADVPCSALGLLRRHPEIRYRRQLGEIPALAARARLIAQNALRYVRPGGRLVFAVCTTTEEEGPAQAAALLAAAPAFSLTRTEMAPALWEETPIGPVFSTRSDPHLDGFFAAVFTRQA